MSSTCAIPSDPDIAGIGVRIAIYVQNLLCFVPAIWALWDGKVSVYELDSAETHATNNLILAFAILISTIVQARTLGLTNYHASIVLSLSWMNNTNAFVYFLLYIQHKSQPGPEYVEPRWSAWVKFVGGKFRPFSQTATEDLERPTSEDAKEAKIPGEPTKYKYRYLSGVMQIFRRVALFLGSVHLSFMAALGIWLWRNPGSFGKAEKCAIDHATFAILGNDVPLGSNALQIFSIVLYSLSLTPAFNLLIPMLVFFWLFVGCHGWLQRHYPTYDTHRHPDPADPWYLRYRPNSQAFPSFPGVLVLLVVNLIFLVDIELTIRWNRHLQSPDETRWAFGQILAVLLLSVPVRDLIEVIFSRWGRQQNQLLWEARTNTDELRGAIGRGDINSFAHFIQRGADVNVESSGKYLTALQAACDHYSGNIEVIQLLLSEKADPNAQGGECSSPLYIAAEKGHHKVVKLLLLDKRTNPNLQCADYPIPLYVAAEKGHDEVIRRLLGGGAEPNLHFGRYASSLYIAAENGHYVVVKCLLEGGANPDLQVGNYSTPLVIAAENGHHEVVNLLSKPLLPRRITNSAI